MSPAATTAARSTAATAPLKEVVLYSASSLGAVTRSAEGAERRATALLDALRIDWCRVFLDLEPQRWHELEIAGYRRNRSGEDLPQLVAGGYLVGGAREMQGLQDEGKLRPVIEVLAPSSLPRALPAITPGAWTSPERCGGVTCQARVRQPSRSQPHCGEGANASLQALIAEAEDLLG